MSFHTKSGCYVSSEDQHSVCMVNVCKTLSRNVPPVNVSSFGNHLQIWMEHMIISRSHVAPNRLQSSSSTDGYVLFVSRGIPPKRSPFNKPSEESVLSTSKTLLVSVSPVYSERSGSSFYTTRCLCNNVPLA